jgi:hypothetical protein
MTRTFIDKTASWIWPVEFQILVVGKEYFQSRKGKCLVNPTPPPVNPSIVSTDFAYIILYAQLLRRC